mgnify:FL=1
MKEALLKGRQIPQADGLCDRLHGGGDGELLKYMLQMVGYRPLAYL